MPSAAKSIARDDGSLTADLALAIPFLPAAADLYFYVQGGVVVLGFNPGGVVFSGALSARIGR